MDNQSHHGPDGVQPWGMNANDNGHHESNSTHDAPNMEVGTIDPEQITERAATVSSLYPSLDKEKDSTPSTAWAAPSVGSMEPIGKGPDLGFSMPSDDRPIPVVKVLSVRGVEYAMMSILLWFGAGSLIFILTSLINGGAGFDSLAFPISMLLVCLPGFAFFFLRLKKAELADPSLRLEASKRRFSQITQILAFLTCFINIVAVIYLLVGMAGGNEVDNIGKVIGTAFVILIVAGGILYYYWVDEHKLVGNR